MKKAFVTGGTGFVGINLIHQLLDKGWKVVALYRSDSSKEKLTGLDIEWVKGTITDLESLEKGIPDDTDAIFHLAGSTNYWKKNYPSQYATNVTGTENMVKVAVDKKIEKFVFTSSIASFGLINGKIDESTESNAPFVKQYYSYTKWLGEQEVKRAVKEDGLHGVILNPAHIVGPHDSHNWVGMFMQVHKGKLPAIPSGFGQYAHVRDIAAAHIAAAEKGRAGEQYILGGVDANFLQFINAIQEVMGKPLSKKDTPDFVLYIAEYFFRIGSWFSGKQPLLTTDMVKLLLKKVEGSDAKAEKELGFTTCSLKEQVEDTYNWLLAEGKL